MQKSIEVIPSPEAEEVLTYLKERAPYSKKERSLLNAINRKIKLIKQNPHIGDSIAKMLIPKEYKEKYLTSNLYRIELPNYWRMLYTLTDGETKVEIIAFVIDILDHPAYNKKFRYKKK